MTLVELVESSPSLAPRTKALYRVCLEDFIRFAGDDPLAYTPHLVESWFSALLKARKPQTVNVFRKAIRYASKRLAKHERRPEADFARDVEKVNAKKPLPRVPLSYDEADKLLATCDDDRLIDIRDRALIVLALRSGLRRGGLHALELAGISPPKITTINKGGEFITFEADAETFAALDVWLNKLRQFGVTQGPVFLNVNEERLATEKKLRMSPFQIWQVFTQRAKHAGIRHVFPHLARHSTVTWLREAGKTSAEVSKLTGQTEQTIENIYTHVRSEGAVGAALPSLRKVPVK